MVPSEGDKVWIMNPTRFDRTRHPMECRVTIGTPHLCAPIDFMNHGSTFGTWFRIFTDECHCFYRIWITRVSITPPVVTVFTVIGIAQTTKPLVVQKPFTRFEGTLSTEYTWIDRFIFPVPDHFDFTVRMFHLCMKIFNGWMEQVGRDVCL
jgi:hypothetical protein